jgi:hypothetical protein
LMPPGSAPHVDLMLSGFTGAHSVVKVPGGRYKSCSVATVDFQQALRAIRPDVLKVDVESAEYMLFDGLGPGDLASVAALFIEFHPIADRDERIARVRALVLREGFVEVETRRRRYTALRKPRARQDGDRPPARVSVRSKLPAGLQATETAEPVGK